MLKFNKHCLLIAFSLFGAGCKSDPKNISGIFETVPNSKDNLIVSVAQAGDKATTGEIKAVVGNKQDLVGSITASVGYFGRISYVAHFEKGECRGNFEAEFDRGIQDPESLTLKFFGNSSCPETTYLLNQSKFLKSINGPQN